MQSSRLSKKVFTRRNFFGACFGAFGGLGWMRWGEAEWLDVTERRLKLETKPQRNLDSPSLRILHLSDFHASPVVRLAFIQEAVDLGVSLKPNLICLTGDFITATYGNFGEYGKILRKLGEAAPSFACVGNHDGGSWIGKWGYRDWMFVAKMLEGAGITLLHNSARTLNVNGAKLQMVGVGDLWAKELNAAKAFADSEKELPTVLLSHNPDSKTALDDFPWDLMLCGHTHGGQLKLPFFGTPFAPVRDHRYVAGLNEWQGRWIHTTRGVGNLHGMRFNCRPEVSILKIEV